MPALYAAWSAGDVPAVVACLHPDVDWPEPWSGGRVRGQDAVAAHLTAQGLDLRLTLRPLEVRATGGGLAVTVHQVVRDTDGDVLSDTTVLHTLTVRDGLVGRLDVGEPPP